MAPTETVSYQRRKKQRDGAVNDTGLRFGEDVPREIIAVKDPEIEAIPAERREQIGEKVTYRLAQRPGSYVILEYTRPVYKLLDDLTIVTTPAPANVLEKSAADVSFLAGMLVDKFCYHCVLRMRPSREWRKQCFTEDEGRPLGVGLQERASNHHKLRASRALVVSVVGNGGTRFRQVRFKETNASEPLMTCRKEF